MWRVYVAGPLSCGDLLTNLNNATAAFTRLAQLGFSPFCPHWSAYSNKAFEKDGKVYCEATAAGSDSMHYEDWIRIDLNWVRASHAVLRLEGHSPGGDREVDEARRNGIPVFYSIDEVVDYFKLLEEIPF